MGQQFIHRAITGHHQVTDRNTTPLGQQGEPTCADPLLHMSLFKIPQPGLPAVAETQPGGIGLQRHGEMLLQVVQQHHQ